MLLLVILAWVIQPVWFLLESRRVAEPTEVPAERAGVHATKAIFAAKNPILPEKKITPPGDLETGAGRAIPGEKVLLFANPSSYQKFLGAAPVGMILDQIDGLRAVRVRDGEWLKSWSNAHEMTRGNIYPVGVPQVPPEVKTMGDLVYRVVGKDALELMGAGAMVPGWGKGIQVALLDTNLMEAETSQGSEAGHGVSMRSLITGNPGSVPGAAPAALVVNYPVLDGEGKGDSFTLAQAIVRAVDGGARVINMSLGSEGDSPVVKAAVDYALYKNVALIAAAGNEAVNRVSYPAAYEGVLAVASVDGDRQQLYFSNRGPSVGLAAPGFAVVADWPGGKKVEISGTSASTALVSGVVAALLAKEPGLTGTQAVELLKRYADDTGLVGRDDETGYGVVDLQRVLERNQRGIVDLAVAGVQFDPAGKLTVAVQNRGTETVNSLMLDIAAGGNSRKFYLGSLAPGQSLAETVQFDGVRAKQDGGIAGTASVEAPRGSDQRSGNDLWSGYFKISK